MAQKFLSPGVFTKEIDQSFLAQGVQGIGAVLIGRTLKGPAFVPTIVRGFDEFSARFGITDPNLQMPYAAKNYLKNAGTLTVVRVLGSADGTGINNGYQVGHVAGIADMSASTGQVLAVVHYSGALAAFSVAGVAADANNFVVKFGSVFAATASFLTSSDNYISKVLNTDPTLYSTYGHYLYQLYPFVSPVASASWTAVSGAADSNTFERDYSHGITAWVKSQPVGGTDYNLFRFHTLGDGDSANKDVKVMIANVKPSTAPTVTPYGTFDVVIRDFFDTDQKQSIIETYVGCTMDPMSPNFVGRRIGDKFEQFDTNKRKFYSTGTYPLKSKYVRIELATGVNAPGAAVPWGFRGYTHLPFGSGSAEVALPYVTSLKDRSGNYDSNTCWGVQFVSGGIYDRMRATPDSTSGYAVSDADFTLANLSGTYVSGRLQYAYYAGTNGYLAIQASASYHKFTLPFAGGFGGFDIRVQDPLYLNNSDDETVLGVVSLKRAVDCISNPDAFDMNLIAVPGINNLKVTDYARSMVNNRMDAFYVMDVTGASVDEAAQLLNARSIDDNYTAAYYPDLWLDDSTSNRVVRVAPSVAMVGVLAFNDRVGQPWFAPAGLNRGGMGQFGVNDVVDRLNFTDRDTLQQNRINPIATFPNEGIVAWGQKTLQLAPSALDRVNVRRLMIFAKKTVAAAAKLLVFEPNNPATWQRFTNTVNPILENVRQNNGVERFKVVMDQNTNTPDVVDRNIMAGKIFLQPTKSAEFIDLSFIITNAGVAFGE